MTTFRLIAVASHGMPITVRRNHAKDVIRQERSFDDPFSGLQYGPMPNGSGCPHQLDTVNLSRLRKGSVGDVVVRAEACGDLRFDSHQLPRLPTSPAKPLRKRDKLTVSIW